MSESESYAKAEFFRKPNLSEYLPNVPKCGLNTRHDNREVTLIHLTRAQTLRSDKCATGSIHEIGQTNLIQVMKNSVCPKAKVIRRPNFSEYLPNVPKWHLFIWRERILCALTNAPPVQSIQTGQWLSTLFHANCSDAQVYVLHPRQFIFALSCRRRSFLQYYNPLSAKKDIIIINLKSDLRFYSWRVCIVMFLELSILIDIWSSFRVLSELSPWVITRWIKKIMPTNPSFQKQT